MTITTTNPATEKPIKVYQKDSSKDVSEKINQAHNCFSEWKKTTFSHRANLMQKAAQLLKDKTDKYAKIITEEMGKPIKEARSEVEKCAWVCEYYAEYAQEFLKDEVIETDATKSFVTHQPIGVVLAVMPWNYPFWQVFRFAAPTLMAGNVGILKHASNVPGSALAIQEIFEEAGFPKNAFTTLLISGSEVEPVIKNPKVRAVTLTGSGPAGESVAATAGREIKKSVLELGGSDAYLVLEDADLELAAETCVKSRLLNTGQSCIGAKRFILLPEIYEEFLQLFKEKMQAAKMGDPMNEETDLGPMARKDLREELHNQVLESINKGANCILGGKIPDREGAFYPATILTNVQPGMPAYDNELFGPVASIIRAKDEQNAIAIANSSQFGLGAAVFTKDSARGERIAAYELEAGCCFVNGLVKSDPRLPFGGVKVSGYGRELSHHGIKEFVNVKTVWVK